MRQARAIPRAKGQRKLAFSALLGIVLAGALLIGVYWPRQTVLRIYDWQTGDIYVEAAARPGDTLFFGWIHSLEQIPWNEYYYIADDLSLVLDTISFPAFGAGIPENKGGTCRIEDGLIYMEDIGQGFEQFFWLNSHTAVQEICLNGHYLTRGSELPHHRKLILRIERRGLHV